MAIEFAAITPHAPILIPAIGKDNTKQLYLTNDAFFKLSEKLSLINPDTILIISPHGLLQNNAFTLNLNPSYAANFEDFGDFSTKKTWPGNVGLSYQIREALETSAPLQLISECNLDHGSSVPLFMLTEKIQPKIIPLNYSGLNNSAHFEFGQQLGKILQARKRKIAIIASGDLSHRLTKNAPAGYSAKGKKFDKRLIECLRTKEYNKILEIDEELIITAGECGLKSILILLGMINKINHQPKQLAYEFPFGIGYLTMDFEIMN